MLSFWQFYLLRLVMLCFHFLNLPLRNDGYYIESNLIIWAANQLNGFFMIDNIAKWRVNYVAYIHQYTVCMKKPDLKITSTSNHSEEFWKIDLLKLANPRAILMKKYRYNNNMGLCKKLLFKNSFSRASAVASFEIINISWKVSMNYFFNSFFLE